MTDELKNCPCCKAPGLVTFIEPHSHLFCGMPDYTGGEFVECTKCSMASSSIADWQTRTPSDVTDKADGGDKAKPKLGKSPQWVNCPVCGEPDMRKSGDDEEGYLIFCVNHACTSNGGGNADALQQPDNSVLVEALKKARMVFRFYAGDEQDHIVREIDAALAKHKSKAQPRPTEGVKGNE